MQISARNQLRGRVTAVRLGTVMAEVTLDLGGGNSLTSVITRGAAERLGLEEGDEVSAIVKATSVMIGK